jgi:hypothetical protein
MHATTKIIEIDDTVHIIDKELTLHHNHEVVVWGYYLMTQYNIKLELQKFGERGTKAAVAIYWTHGR